MRILLSAVLILLGVSPAIAQVAPRWTGEVKLTKPLFVTTVDGDRIEGVAGQITSEAIVVSTPTGIRTVPYALMRKVEKRDGLANGITTGAGIGFVFGLVVALTTQCDGCGSELAGIPFGGALYGGLIGWGIDAAVKGRQTIYEQPTTTVSVVPRRGGLAATIALRW